MKNGYIKAEAFSPQLKVADCRFNAEMIIKTLEEADKKGTQLAVFPELSITGSTCGDLFLQLPLQNAADTALAQIAEATAEMNLVAVVGVPLHIEGKLYNCAAVISHGCVLGIVPKTVVGAQSRWFAPAPSETIMINIPTAPAEVPFGTDVLFRCAQLPSFVLAVEIGEDLNAPITPATYAAMAGATVIVNISADSEWVGKAKYRRTLIEAQSAKSICAYIYANAGSGESSTDFSFSGHSMIAENGHIISESAPYAADAARCEIDTELLAGERVKTPSFEVDIDSYSQVIFDLDVADVALEREYSSFPFILSDEWEMTERCELILNIQAEALAKRMAHTHSKTAVIGISGGLDSCLAILVTARAMKKLGKPMSDILAITMPCFGTSKRTRSNAEILCDELGVAFEEINIADMVTQHFKDIGQDMSNMDVTFENAQARVRTLVLMDRANQVNGLVIGTGDLSELALGWATYNGDHMSMYGVNGGVPKTLVRRLVKHEADLAVKCSNITNAASGEVLRNCLIDILETPISPELLPTTETGEIAQETESIVGPYEIHDFYIYYILRYGFSPQKVFRLAQKAFGGKYEDEVLVFWLRNFYRRFFAQQFKRSCLADGPKVGRIGLSPRGDWNMPSDALNSMWMAEVEELEAEMKK